VFLAGSILFYQLLSCSGAWGISAILALLWLLGSTAGGSIEILIQKDSGSRRWCGVLTGGAALTLTGASLILGPANLAVIAAAMAIPTTVLYGFGKIGCSVFGCCGWSGPQSRTRRKIPLQIIEAAGSFLLGLILLGFQVAGAAPAAVVAVFFVGHGSTRIFSRLGRSPIPVRSLSAIDSGWLVLFGLVLAFLSINV